MGRMSHVVVAPDKVKGTLTATQVASHVAAGFVRVRPDLTRCREQAGPLLEDLAERVARDWLVP